MSVIIQADSLRKKYGDFVAVDGISFAIEEGECFGFLGPNGAGKTTTVRMIHCVSPKSAGALTVLGSEAGVDNRAVKQRTGVIPQEITLDNDLTVRENLQVHAHFFAIPRLEARRRIDELLRFVELEKRRDSKISDLSTGMKRRLLIARALLNQPRLIIADEPTTGLDPQARHLIWQRLRQLKGQGATLVLTTQYMEEAQQLCDRLVIMHQGRILRAGAPVRLIAEEIGREVLEVRAGADQDGRLLAALAPLARGHERVGDSLYFYCDDGRPLMRRTLELDLADTVHRPATLEDVFLKLTGRSLIE
jgi:lipooligosaccharide transport system ATP-binding protein